MAASIVKCEACNADISIQAEKCPHCGHPNKKFKKKGGCLSLIAVAFAIVVVLAWIGSMTDKTLMPIAEPVKTDATPPTPAEERLLEVTAAELAHDYNENTVAADAKFKGVTFKVTGKVTEINTDIMGNPYLQLSGGVNEFMQPHFNFDKNDSTKLATLKKGSKVTLICTGIGDVAKIPMSDDCSLL